MGCFAASKLPDPFNGVKLRAVRRHEFQDKLPLVLLSPFLMEASVMILDVVEDKDCPLARMRTDPAKMLKEAKECLAVEPVFLAAVDKLAVSETHRTKIANTFSGRMVKKHRVFNLRRYPHTACRTILLEPSLIYGPEVNPPVPFKGLQFFYIPSAHPGQRERSVAAACAVENRVAERVAGTVSPPGRCSIGGL